MSNSEHISETWSESIAAEARRISGQLAHCEHRWWGWVYVVSAVGTPLVKVGWCHEERLEARIRSLQNMSAVRLRLLLLMVSTRADEQAYHIQMDRFRHHGEWFDNTDKEIILHFMGGWEHPISVPCRFCAAPVFGCAPPEVSGCVQKRHVRVKQPGDFFWREKRRSTLASPPGRKTRRVRLEGAGKR